MKTLSLEQAILRRRILRANILLGFIVFAVAFYLMVTGHYDSYLERKAADAYFNRFAIGGLLYSAVFWLSCILSKPLWFPFKNKEQE